jgi:anti-sigma regulatory factor (Ser/Thr protein kinase)
VIEDFWLKYYEFSILQIFNLTNFQSLNNEMKDLSLHILDIAQNSVSAGAKNVIVEITENTNGNYFTILIQDDGKGIPADIIEKVTDPYYTTRTTRKVGLGLPLFKQNAEMAGGEFKINSEPGRGTVVKATFRHDHMDRPPLGDIAGVIVILISSNPMMNWYYKHTKDGSEYILDTRDVREVLEDVPLNEPSVGRYLREMIRENLKEMGVG